MTILIEKDFLSPIDEKAEDFVHNKSNKFANLKGVMTKARVVNKWKNGYKIIDIYYFSRIRNQALIYGDLVLPREGMK